ncbi:MAG: winged helix-turn-helix transcriptional regulator [Deltaproteobacteria bacterium]|nr:winged helix-turn-helix transcriptional regulator [Deltaproteobacteria bacterium]
MNIELIKSTENSALNPGALLSVVNPKVATFLYIQIREHFQSGIQSGVYPVHTRLPSETQLAESFKVSRMTVTKAIKEL